MPKLINFIQIKTYTLNIIEQHSHRNETLQKVFEKLKTFCIFLFNCRNYVSKNFFEILCKNIFSFRKYVLYLYYKWNTTYSIAN